MLLAVWLTIPSLADEGEKFSAAITNQVALSQCAGSAFEETDAELNRVYQEILLLYADDPVFIETLR